MAYLSEFYQNDRKRGYYIATEEDDFELYVAYAVIYEVWSLRETKGQNMTLSSVISESDTLTGTNDLSKLANGLKGRFKKFLK